jgi:predicted  nucleic acid-binding Zn-ribbon protein
MHPELEVLVQLQRVETRLKQAQSAKDDVPRRRAALEEQLALERRHLEAARAVLDECQKARRQHEGTLQTLEAKRTKYKGQLMEVKTNKEYTAMLHEIEGVERDIRACEDEVLVELERAETLGADVQKEERAFKETEVQKRQEMSGLDAEGRAAQTQLEGLERERAEVVARLPADALGLFQRVAKVRGTAVSEAREGMCLECHMKVRPQMFVEVKRNDQIVQCPQCSRILFYEPPVPTVDVQP